MARYVRRRKSVRPFRAMRKARMYRSAGLGAFGRRIGRFVGRKISNAVHTFRKQVVLSPIFETGSDQHLGYQFNLDQLADEGDFQNLYDSYKIHKVILTLEPQFSGTNTNAVGPYQKWLRIVHDYDDITPLASQNAYLEYGGCKSKLAVAGRVISIPLYPKIQQYTQSGDGSTSVFRAIKAGWIPTAHDQVQHLGLKIFVPTMGLTNGYGIFAVRATFVFSCRATK